MDTFQTELKAFMKNLIKVFPDDRELKLLSSSLNIALMDDPEQKVMLGFYTTLKHFEHYIDTRNPAFFEEYNASDLPLMKKLNSYWENLNEDNRKIVWDYLQVLFLLSKRAHFVQKH